MTPFLTLTPFLNVVVRGVVEFERVVGLAGDLIGVAVQLGHARDVERADDVAVGEPVRDGRDHRRVGLGRAVIGLASINGVRVQ